MPLGIVDQVPLPARKVVPLGVPVMAMRFDVPRPAKLPPDPANVVALIVPTTFKAPLSVVVPIAICLVCVLSILPVPAFARDYPACAQRDFGRQRAARVWCAKVIAFKSAALLTDSS
jgi:hypothetical protein